MRHYHRLGLPGNFVAEHELYAENREGYRLREILLLRNVQVVLRQYESRETVA